MGVQTQHSGREIVPSLSLKLSELSPLSHSQDRATQQCFGFITSELSSAYHYSRALSPTSQRDARSVRFSFVSAPIQGMG
jgi:hypothetical protein